MQKYSFMGRKAMKNKDIPSYVKSQYAMNIDNLIEWESIYKKMEQILENTINKDDISELYEINKGQYDETDEIKLLKDTISDIITQISKVDFFIPDLTADYFMGLLYIDEECNVTFDPRMEWAWGPMDEEDKKKYKKKKDQISDNLVRILDAQKHYPYAKYESENFLLDGIPGGCKEYHKLMIKQENIDIFATSIDKENKNISYKRYGFFKTHDIFEELKNAPIENLLLLEKTQGIGYTNQLFCYAKDFKTKNLLNKFEEVITPYLELPMFIRKYITNKICGYLKSFGYSDLSIQYVRKASGLITKLAHESYKAILEIYWYANYWAYWQESEEDRKKENEMIRSELKKYWERYFDEETAYSSMIESEHIHDWRGIEKVQDCFYGWEDEYRVEGSNLLDDNKIIFVDIRIDDYTEYRLAVQGPRNELGEYILQMTAKRLNEEIGFKREIQDKLERNIKLRKEIDRLSSAHQRKPVVRIISTRAAKNDSSTYSQKNAIRDSGICQKERNKEQKKQELYKQIEENNRDLYYLFYQIRCRIFMEQKKKEQEIWEKKDIKGSAKKLKPLHVYTLIHIDIVRFLND